MNVQPIWVIYSPPPIQISSAHGVTLLWSSQYLRLPLRTGAEALMSKGFPLLAARALCPVQRNILHLCTPHVLGHTTQPRYTLGSLSGIFCSAVSLFLLQRAAEELCSWLPELRAQAQMQLSLLRECSDVDRPSLCQVWGSDPPRSTQLWSLCFQVLFPSVLLVPFFWGTPSFTFKWYKRQK